MLKMSPRSKMESLTCDYEKKTKTEKGHFKTLALSGQCNKLKQKQKQDKGETPLAGGGSVY